MQITETFSDENKDIATQIVNVNIKNSGTLNLDMTNRIRWPRVTIRSPYNKRTQLSPVAKRVQMLKLILIRDCFSYNIQRIYSE